MSGQTMSAPLDVQDLGAAVSVPPTSFPVPGNPTPAMHPANSRPEDNQAAELALLPILAPSLDPEDLRPDLWRTPAAVKLETTGVTPQTNLEQSQIGRAHV